MSDFKAKMLRIQFRLGLHPRPRWGSFLRERLVGLPASLIQRLQSVQNAAARLIYSIRRSGHITDALIGLNWLRLQEQVVAVLT